MGKLNIIITADYEVFGDGSGCVDRCLVEPSERIALLCDKYNAKATFFVDVCEYWAFKEGFKAGNAENGYNPAQKIEEQLRRLVQKGHDVQLHFHPQWLDYRYLGDQKWQVNPALWRLADVASRGEYAIDDLFKKGKETLEKLLRAVKPDYRCDIFRAGAWCIQPEEIALKAMRNHHFKIDSSVACGMKFNDGKTIYDFTAANERLPFWDIAENVCVPVKDGSLKEIPIFTTSVHGFNLLFFNALKVAKRIPLIPAGCHPDTTNYPKKSLISRLLRSIQTQRRMFNFCDATSFEEMVFMTKQARRRFRNYLQEADVPVVVIGHPKTFGNAKEFEKYLKWANGREYVTFSSYRYGYGIGGIPNTGS